MAADHIETRTPEEMHQAIYERLRKRGDAFSREFKHNYKAQREYLFSFDKLALYTYVGNFHSLEADLRIYAFKRKSDSAKLLMTQYSEPPILIEQ